MTEATVLKLIEPKKRTTKKTSTERRTSAATKRIRKLQLAAGLAVCSVGFLLTALSLSHLAEGLMIMGASRYGAWSFAIATDLGFVVLELAMLSLANNARAHSECSGAAKTMIICMMIGSAFMNALAFAEAASGWLIYPAVVFGLAIPAMIFGFTRIGSKMYLLCSR